VVEEANPKTTWADVLEVFTPVAGKAVVKESKRVKMVKEP